MPLITFNRIEPGDPRDRSVPNTLYAALNAAVIDGDNLAVEGLDRASFQWEAVSRSRHRVSVTTRTGISASSWATLATLGGSITIAESARIRYAVQFESIDSSGSVSPGIPLGDDIEIRMVRVVGMTSTVIAGTHMRIGNFRKGPPTNQTATNGHGSLLLEGWVTAGTYDDLRVQYQVNGGGTVYYSNWTYSVREYRRAF